MRKLEEHAATMVRYQYVLPLGWTIVMLIRLAAGNGRRAEPVVGIARFSSTECTRPGESGEHCCRGGGNVGGLGYFFPGKGSSAFSLTVSH
jgi:hypothetical protein